MSSVLKKVIIIVSFIFVVTVLFFIVKKDESDVKRSMFSITFETNVKISLLNGCGYRGIATEIKDYFVEKNFEMVDIISWKNVPGNNYIYDKTVIVVKKENQEKLNFLMNITGINRKIYSLNDDNIEEFQIILGKDYKKYFNK